MKKIFKFSLVSCVILLTACDYAAPQYPKVGEPENLIDVSSEKFTFGLNGKNSLAKLTTIIEQDKPTEAELNCSIKSPICSQAKEIFERNNVSLVFGSSENNNAILKYERAITRDCDQKYVDNMSGSRSYNHPSFGCSIAGNIVQMVGDKKQFTNPSLMDFPDAEKASQSYSGYLQPSVKRDVKPAQWSTGSSSK